MESRQGKDRPNVVVVAVLPKRKISLANPLSRRGNVAIANPKPLGPTVYPVSDSPDREVVGRGRSVTVYERPASLPDPIQVRDQMFKAANPEYQLKPVTDVSLLQMPAGVAARYGVLNPGAPVSSELDARDARITPAIRAKAYDPFYDFGTVTHEIQGLELDIQRFTKSFIDEQRAKKAAGGVLKIAGGIAHTATLGAAGPMTGPMMLGGDVLIADANENLADRNDPAQFKAGTTTVAKGVVISKVISKVGPHINSAVGFSLVPIAGGLLNVALGFKAILEAYQYEGFDLSLEQRQLITNIKVETKQLLDKVNGRGQQIMAKKFLGESQKESYMSIIEQLDKPLNQILKDAHYALDKSQGVRIKQAMDKLS